MHDEQVGLVADNREDRGRALLDGGLLVEVVDALVDRPLAVGFRRLSPLVPIDRPEIVQHVPALVCRWDFCHISAFARRKYGFCVLSRRDIPLGV